MTDSPLAGRRVLVVEDEYLLAEDIRIALEGAGAAVLGPAPSVNKALALVQNEPEVDAAVLDVNLGGQRVFPVADALAERGVPIVFTTGYDRSALPERYARAARLEKPFDPGGVVRIVDQLLSDPGAGRGLSA